MNSLFELSIYVVHLIWKKIVFSCDFIYKIVTLNFFDNFSIFTQIPNDSHSNAWHAIYIISALALVYQSTFDRSMHIFNILHEFIAFQLLLLWKSFVFFSCVCVCISKSHQIEIDRKIGWNYYCGEENCSHFQC